MKLLGKIIGFLEKTCITFAISVILLCLLNLVVPNAAEISTMFALANVQGIGIFTLLQYVWISGILNAARMVLTSERLFQTWSAGKRAAVMIVSVFIFIGLFAYWFKWFPVDRIAPWIGTCVCFGICFLIGILIIHVKTKANEKLYAEKLEQYKIKGEQHDKDI